jgi:hypothetical protein
MTDLEQLAERMAAIDAPWLAWAVHTRNPAVVSGILCPLTVQELYALAVALASQIPQPRTRPDDGVVDEVVVERAADLAHPLEGPLTRAERAEAIRLMVSRRVPFKRIVQRFQVNHRVIAALCEGEAS